VQIFNPENILARGKMSKLDKQFDAAMLGIYQRAKSEVNYNATLFLRMLDERRGLATAQHLINSDQPSEGYTRLYEKGRLDLTVEALVVEDQRWHCLFSEDELARARKRLISYGYTAQVRGTKQTSVS
jgi:hypothetical protein